MKPRVSVIGRIHTSLRNMGSLDEKMVQTKEEDWQIFTKPHFSEPNASDQMMQKHYHLILSLSLLNSENSAHFTLCIPQLPDISCGTVVGVLQPGQEFSFKISNYTHEVCF
ncbi:hypothetical protein RF11_10887 [Thelohanellus kitauei]|uniref:Uncharacterized protein n=1 Tax=Thelohanellus kitauei TaxID=669202 RepID=A0A0C2I6J5_THEKT|nr:hypothetical protein RF11_10887 [Thelohanellus kitauei]